MSVTAASALRRTASMRALSTEEASLLAAQQALARIARGEVREISQAEARALLADRHDRQTRLTTVLRHLAEAAEREAGLHARIEELVSQATGGHE